MPYTSISALPAQTDRLPKAAKRVWLEAFNAALDEYGSDETAAKVAWAAVKRDYKKNGAGEWVKKQGVRAGIYIGTVHLLSADDEELRALFGERPIAGELLYFKGVLARAETNKNCDRIDEQGVKEICDTLPYMPLDVEHRDREVCGIFLRAYPVDNDTAVGVEGVIFARRYPEIAEGVTDGTQKLSIEARAAEVQCSVCSGVFSKVSHYCDHLKLRYQGSGAERMLHSLAAFGGAATATPAGTRTEFDPDSLTYVASELEDEDDTLAVQLEAKKEVDGMGPDKTEAVEVSAAEATEGAKSEGAESVATGNAMPMSFEQMRNKISQKMRDMMGDENSYGYLDATYPDHAIWVKENYADGTRTGYKVPYSFGLDGECTLGEPTEMEQVWQPVEGYVAPEVQIRDLQAKVTDLAAKLEAAEAKGSEVAQSLTAAQSDLEGTQCEKAQLEARTGELQASLDMANSEVSELRAKVAEHTAGERVARLARVIGEDAASEKREKVAGMGEEEFNTLLASVEDARKAARPKAGSLKGIFGSERTSTPEPRTTFKGTFSGAEES